MFDTMGLNYLLYDVWEKEGDKDLMGLPFIGSPFKYLALIATPFLFYVLYLGPKWMVKKPARDPRPLMLILYGMCFGANGVGIPLGLVGSHFGDYIWDCDVDINDRSNLFTTSCKYLAYLYLVTCIMDMATPVFNVLMKKKQAPLFLVHLVLWPLFISISIGIYPGGALIFCILIHCVYRLFFYMYRVMDAASSELRVSKNWGQKLRVLHFITFLAMFIHLSYHYFHAKCGVQWVTLMMTTYCGLASMAMLVALPRNTSRSRKVR